MPSILLPSRVCISFFLSRLFLLSSGLVLLDQSFFNQSLAAQAQIIPNGAGTVVNPQGNQINITGGTQAGANLFHSFRDFNVNSSQVANFLSNPQTQNILARINGGNPSLINGLLQVTGGNSNLFLMNPAGIIFGQGSSLNVTASFTATTANQIGFGNNNFFNAVGDNNFSALTGNPDRFLFTTTRSGSIVNAGNLAVGNGQNISLIAGNTINTGRLTAPGGEIQVLAVPGTNRVRLSQPGQVLSLEIIPPVDGVLRAIDLPALLTGNDLPGIQVDRSGQLQIAGTTLPNQQGLAVASGSIDVSSSTGNGGVVQVMGDRVAALNSRINANGATGGGTVRLGGEYRGGGINPFNSRITYVDATSFLNADTTNSGDGGRIIVWADDTTRFYGNISARGGANAGNGGFAEVSGAQNLTFAGQADLSATQGRMGTLLLDPVNIFINNGTDALGGCTLPTISVACDPGNITISQATLEALPASANILLEATNNITIGTLTGNALNFATGPGGAITFYADRDGNGVGNFSMNSGTAIQAYQRDINISAVNITTGAINTSTSFIQLSNGGNITLNATNGNITALNSLYSGSEISGNGGNISLTASRDITSGNINSQASLGNAGYINLTAGGNINNNINSLTELGSPSSGLGNGAAINLNAGGNIISGNLTSFAFTGNGGSINLNAGGNIAITSNVNSFGYRGNGASVNLNAPNGNVINSGYIFTESVIGSSGTGGRIDINAGNLVLVTGITTARDGNQVSISTQGGSNGGVINITHGGGVTVPFLVGGATTNGTQGAITSGTGANTVNNVTVPVPPGINNYGTNISIRTYATLLNVPTSNTSNPSNLAQLFTLLRNPDAPPTPAAVVVGAPSLLEPIPVVEPPAPLPVIISPVIPIIIPAPIISPPVAANPILPPVAIAQPITPPITITPPSELLTTLTGANAPIVPEPPSGTLTLITNPSRVEIASRLNLGFGDRLPSQTAYNLPEIQNNLNQTTQTTGIKPALIYFFFVPDRSGIREKDTLEVILITEKGEPLRVQFLDVTRRQVLAVANNLRDSSIYLPPANSVVSDNPSTFFLINAIGESRSLQTTNANRLTTRLTVSSGVDDPRFNLNAARQMYQWLLAPLEQELQQQGINNLVFIGGEELQGIPLAGLYDGQRFVRERYIIR